MELQLIKGGEAHPVDAERIVPGRILARFENDDLITIAYSYGPGKYARRVIYKTPAAAAESFSEWIDHAQVLDHAEWTNLRALAGPAENLGRREGDRRMAQENPTEEPKLPGPTEEAHQVYGHRWEAHEFLHELQDLVEAGEVLIAHDSQFNTSYYSNWDWKAPEGCWKHFAFFRTLEFSLLGNRLFRLVAIHEALPERHEERVSKQTAKCRYRNLRTKLEPLGPLTREEEPRENDR